MADTTLISWCDCTFNGWIGCSKVGLGCLHCYAEADFDLRKHRAHWGPGNPRSRTTAAYWRGPLTWERHHEAFLAEHGHRRRVFCASLSDVFDNEVPPAWRRDLLNLVSVTPHLDWLLLTKRIGNAPKMVAEAGFPRLPDNVWLGATMVTRAEFLRDLDRLRAVPAAVHFVSAEPLLEDIGEMDLRGIDWLIVGGESGRQARPMDIAWVRGLQRLCAAQDVAFFYKQFGGVRTKGDCLLDGAEAKQWPRTGPVAPRFQQQELLR